MHAHAYDIVLLLFSLQCVSAFIPGVMQPALRGVHQTAYVPQPQTLGTLALRSSSGDGSSDSPTSPAFPPSQGALSVLVPIADDSEEVETACITDVLVRAGVSVTTASVMPQLQVKMSRGLKIVADKLIDECADQSWDAIVLPGGMPGAEHLRDSSVLKSLMEKQNGENKTIAAVCASPAVVFAAHGLLPESATCYPAPKFKEILGSMRSDDPVVVSKNVITSQGPGTSLQFALKIVEALCGEAKAKEIAGAMLTTCA